MISHPKKIIALIAALNEEKTIAMVVKGVLAHVREVIVVDDGSTDTTRVRAEQAGAIVLQHKKNLGYDVSLGDAMHTALQRNADIIITFDGDGQHDPGDIPLILAPLLSEKADCVIGQRPRLFRFGERFFGWYTRIRYHIPDPLCGLKAYTREVCLSVGHFDTVRSIGTQLLLEAIHRGFRIKLFPIHLQDRKANDASRFYLRRISGNYKIIRAMVRVIITVMFT